MKRTKDEKALAKNPVASELEAARKDPALARVFLDAHPERVGGFGSLAFKAKTAWVIRAASLYKKSLDYLEIEAIERSLKQLRSDLLGPAPTKIEELLATRIEICWLQVHFFDTLEGVGAGERSIRLAEYYLKQQDRAHRRYLAAVKALADVRRLLPPVVQVNIGDKQVNVAGNVEAPALRHP